MKKLFSYILIFFVVVQLFAPFSVGLEIKKGVVDVKQNIAEAENCKIVSINIDPLTTKNNSTQRKDSRPELVKMIIETSGCVGKDGITKSITISEEDLISTTKVLEGPDTNPISSNTFSYSFIPGETACEEGSCEITYNIKLIENGALIDEEEKETSFYCTNTTCDNSLTWSFTTDSVEPEADFWFFEITYADGSSFKYSPFLNPNGEEKCNQKRDTISTPEGGVKGECQEKKVDQIVETVVYYYEIFKLGTKVGESSNFNGIENCKTNKSLWDKEHENTDYTSSDCKEKLINQAIGGVDGSGKEIKDNSALPACTWDFWNTIGGCIGIGLYYLFFKTTSLVFGLSGKILDFTLMYSIADSSYRSTFVVEGWGIVRDFCNMFFIFVLLYIAFGTILKLHSVKTKEMIVNVVIIGLLINFSLFATQVIIDASNILTRVFYNQQTIIIGAEKDGTVKAETGDFGEIKLSEAIISKVDPQQLIIQSEKISDIPQKGVNEGGQSGGISAGSFIIVVLLATIVNVIGIIAFLSAGIIFIARVIGLWLAMILAPIAFFSYTVPALKDIKMIGWTKWWPDTLKMAFLAPIFVFFMYLIVKFMDKGLGVISASMKEVGTTKGGMSFVIAIVVPFVFIMILLMKAKDIAKTMSGEIGQSITNGIQKIGGAALGVGLGVATGGAAALGRGLISNPTRMMQTSQATRDAAIKNAKWYSPGTWGKAMSAQMANTGLKNKTISGWNDKLAENKKGLGEKAHATHLLDEQADKIENGKKFTELTKDQQEKAKENVQKEQLSRFLFNGKTSDKLDSFEGKELAAALSMNAAALNTFITKKGKDPLKFHGAEHLEEKYNTPELGFKDKTRMSIASGSYDIRNAKFGLLSPIKWSMQLGLKSLGVNIGTAQRDFMKDLNETLKNALKDIKINVNIDEHGKEKTKKENHSGAHH